MKTKLLDQAAAGAVLMLPWREPRAVVFTVLVGGWMLGWESLRLVPLREPDRMLRRAGGDARKERC